MTFKNDKARFSGLYLSAKTGINYYFMGNPLSRINASTLAFLPLKAW